MTRYEKFFARTLAALTFSALISASAYGQDQHATPLYPDYTHIAGLDSYSLSTLPFRAYDISKDTQNAESLVRDHNQRLLSAHTNRPKHLTGPNDDRPLSDIVQRQGCITQSFNDGTTNLAAVLESHLAGSHPIFVSGTYYQYSKDTGDIYVFDTWLDFEKLNSNEKISSAVRCLLHHFACKRLFPKAIRMIMPILKDNVALLALEAFGFVRHQTSEIADVVERYDPGYSAYTDTFTYAL